MTVEANKPKFAMYWLPAAAVRRGAEYPRKDLDVDANSKSFGSPWMQIQSVE
jgi:hypothetical protein